MSELTKEYLDQQLGKLATKEDIEDVKNLVVSEVANLARMTADGLEEIKRELDVKTQVENLNYKVNRIEQALNIKN